MNLRYLLLAVTCASLSSLAYALDRPETPPEGHGPQGGPPAEALAACKGRQAGDHASISTPHGEMSGTCEQSGQGLALRPDHRPEHGDKPPQRN